MRILYIFKGKHGSNGYVYEGIPIGIELPTAVELKVTHTEPGFKGDTATGRSKPATLETGAVVHTHFLSISMI